jgi:hypothetical protein
VYVYFANIYSRQTAKAHKVFVLLSVLSKSRRCACFCCCLFGIEVVEIEIETEGGSVLVLCRYDRRATYDIRYMYMRTRIV